MEVKATASFLAGVATGWALRSAFGPSRDAFVRLVVVAHRGRTRAVRAVAEHAEWLADLFAEGRARYHASYASPPVDDEAPPNVSSAEPGRAA